MKKMYDDNLIRADRAETLARLQEQVAYERARNMIDHCGSDW